MVSVVVINSTFINTIVFLIYGLIIRFYVCILSKLLLLVFQSLII